MLQKHGGRPERDARWRGKAKLRRVRPGGRLRLAWRRSERLRGFALLSPTLLVMLILLGLPLAALGSRQLLDPGLRQP